MSNKIGNLREFGKFRLDADKRVLWCEGKPVNLALKEIELLCVLTEHEGEVVTKEELLNRVWADSFVEESNLSRHIYVLRRTFKSFGVDGVIETVPRRGYRFSAEINPPSSGDFIIERRSKTRTLIELLHEDESAQVSTAAARVRARIGLIGLAIVPIAVFLSLIAFTGFRGASADRHASPVRSLAVLPFTVIHRTNDSERQGLALADRLINRLSAIGKITVRPTSSVSGFDGTDAGKFARGLEVDCVLEGAIYRLNDTVRVTARLAKVEDNTTLWTGSFEKPARDEIDLHNDIALQVANALVVGLTNAELATVDKRYTGSIDAYRLYVQGRYEWNKRSTPAMKEAERLFRNAIDADPDFALAYIGLADRMVTSDRVEARDLVYKALDLDPDLAEAHATLGFIKMFHEWKWQEAEACFKRSIELNPGYATAHHWYAELLAIQGRYDEAISEMQKAIEINPVSHNFLADLGQIYYFAHRFAEAEDYCKKALEIYPDFVFAYEYLFNIYLQTGEHERAIDASLKADEINTAVLNPSSDNKVTRGNYVENLRAAFRQRGIKGYLDMRTSNPGRDGSSMYVAARNLSMLGETDDALDALEIAYHDQAFLTAFVKADPVFDVLRGHPRYETILRKMALAD